MPYAISSVFNYSLKSSARPSTKKKKKEEEKPKEEKKQNADNNKNRGSRISDNKKDDKKNYEDEVFNQNGDAIDKEGTLKQYILPVDEGYYIGLENNGSSLRLKLLLTGLNEINNPFKTEIPFRIGGKSRKVFFVKPIDPNDENISFMFDLA